MTYRRDFSGARSLALTGSGPGEVRTPTLGIRGPGDSIAIVDPGNGRVSLFSSDLRFVRSFQVPRLTSGVWLSGGGLLINAAVRSRDRFGLPFHSVSLETGEIEQSFGEEPNKNIQLDADATDRRHMAVASADAFWAAKAEGEYTVERWSASGKLLLRLTRRPDWFTAPKGARRRLSMDVPPDPVIVGLLPGEDGGLWTFSLVPDKDWRRGLSPRQLRSPEQVPGFTVSNPARAYDTVVELLDSQGRLVISQRFDDALALPAGDGLVGGVVVGEDGTSTIEVIRPRLLRQ